MKKLVQMENWKVIMRLVGVIIRVLMFLEILKKLISIILKQDKKVQSLSLETMTQGLDF